MSKTNRASADFTFSPENAPVIAALCTCLDGLPLSIELAAARAGVLSLAGILANMDDRFRLLGMGPLDLPERHQTLKAAIDGSYESLPPAQGQFLRRLAVFSGGFSLKAAEIVGECEALGLDGLESSIALVEKSLLNRVRGPAGETRFTLLESIRDYLQDRLRTSGEPDGARRRRSPGFWLGWAGSFG